MSTDQSQTTQPDPYNDPLWEDMEAAIDGGYYSAPSGEGEMGGLDSAARAAVLVARGMKAPQAVAAAIGEHGTYGVKRTYGVVPRKPSEAMLIAARDWSYQKYGKPIGKDDATGCWQAMMEAAENDH